MTPTDDELRATHAREAPHRPHWPPTFEACQLDPLISRVLKLLTQHPREARAPVKHRHQRPPELEACDTPTEPTRAPLRTSYGAGRRPGALSTNQIDGKSRAAGEKPDRD